MGKTGQRQKAPVKVLMIDTVPMIYDGITMVMLNYAGNMDRRGMQIDFVAPNDVEASLRERVERFGSSLYRIPHRNRRPLYYLVRLARLIRRNGYNVVHAHGNSCTLAMEMLAAKLGGAKVRCPHSHNTSCTAPRAHRLFRPLFDRLYTHGFACGEAAGRWLFRDRPFTVLKNGIDAQKYAFDPASRREYRRRLGLDGRIAIGHVAHFNTQKNHRFLIQAFEKVAAGDPRCVLVLVGSGPLEDDVRELAQTRGLENSVMFLGTTQDIPQILSAMDFMVLPSLFEGLPNVLIEWQASGLRALVSDTVTEDCRLTDLIDFLPLDRERWAQAMLDEARREPDRPAASARAVRDIAAAGYDIQGSAARLKALYEAYVDEADGTGS